MGKLKSLYGIGGGEVSKFTPNKDAYYRVIGGKEGLEDAISSGVIRPNPKGAFNERHTYYSKGAPNDASNPVAGGGAKKNTFYKGDYMVEVRPGAQFPEPASNLPQWNFGRTAPGKEISIHEPNVSIYKIDKRNRYTPVGKTAPPPPAPPAAISRGGLTARAAEKFQRGYQQDNVIAQALRIVSERLNPTRPAGQWGISKEPGLEEAWNPVEEALTAAATGGASGLPYLRHAPKVVQFAIGAGTEPVVGGIMGKIKGE